MEFIAEIALQDGTTEWYVPLVASREATVSYSQLLCLPEGHAELDFDAEGHLIGVQFLGFGITPGIVFKIAYA